MYAITSPNLTIQDSIGDFLCGPHRQLWWYCSVDNLEVYHERLDEYYEIYKLPTGVSVPWQIHYIWTASCMDPPDGMEYKLASINRIDGIHIKLSSRATLPREVTSILDGILSWPDQSL